MAFIVDRGRGSLLPSSARKENWDLMQVVGRQSTGSAGITSCAAGDWLDGGVVGSSHSALGA